MTGCAYHINVHTVAVDCQVERGGEAARETDIGAAGSAAGGQGQLATAAAHLFTSRIDCTRGTVNATNATEE